MQNNLAVKEKSEIDALAVDVYAIQQMDAVPRILDVVCSATGMGFAAVARVTDDRWVACCVRDDISFGLKPGSELKIESTICNEIRDHRQPVIIDHVATDAVYATHHTPATYGFQSYISFPIILKDGSFFGTLCAIDPRPRLLTKPETLNMFRLFAQLIAFHIDATLKVEASEARVQEEEQASIIREQFVAVLSHDLRNPLGAISAGAQILSKLELEGRAKPVVAMIRECTTRMQELIENVCDMARGRLGMGITLEKAADAKVKDALVHVIDELRSMSPERSIITDIQLTQPINGDASRIAQVLSNLLANALKYGARDVPVIVHAATRQGMFELSVANGGVPIPPETMERLFQPFTRGDEASDRQGLGLGLYIASEIAKAHQGVLTVTSDVLVTKFTLRMPCL